MQEYYTKGITCESRFSVLDTHRCQCHAIYTTANPEIALQASGLYKHNIDKKDVQIFSPKNSRK